MIWEIVKKQGLLLWRNPFQLVLLIGLPIILIAILGMALGGIMDSKAPEINAKVAIVVHGDEEVEAARFISELERTMLPQAAIVSIMESIDQTLPIKILRESVLGSAALKEIIDLDIKQPNDLEKLKKDDAYAAIIEVPNNFTYEALYNIYFNTDKQPTLKIYKNEGKQIGSSVVTDIITDFQDQLTLSSFVGRKGISADVIQVDALDLKHDIVTINEKEEVATKSYYAVGMAVMNVLFIASAIGNYAFYEQKTNVFDRVILANVSRWTYFTGIFIAGTLFSFIQLCIVFGFSNVFFDVRWPNFTAFLIVTLLVAISVGALSVFLTAISYRMQSEMIMNFFGSIVVAVFAFLGGSFYPLGYVSNTIQNIGNLTPNGAAMSMYLNILRGDGIASITAHLLYLGLFISVLIIIAMFIFPKRGATS